MSRILYLDPFSGIAGDMFVGALLDAGASLDAVQRAVAGIPAKGIAVDAEKVQRGALACTKFHVRVHGEEETPGGDHGHGHSHDHAADHPHGHSHGHGHGRTLAEVGALIEGAELPDPVSATAMSIYRRLADAEARVHGTTPDAIHFHEVGALDAVADVVAASAALHDLAIDEVRCGPIRTGSGMVDTEHGRLPVPAPATLELLAGFDIRLEEGRGELVTPTGAAILAALATPGAPAHLRPRSTGYGAGTRDGGAVPNCLRAVVGEVDDAATEAWELAANIDDQPAEVLARTVDRLMAAGALDAWTQPIGMKKGRPATLLGALVPEEALGPVEDLLFREAGTLGVRRHRVARSTLERERVVVATDYGDVHIKVGRRGDEILVAAPEYDDCLALAEEHGIAVREVMEAARAAWRGRGG